MDSAQAMSVGKSISELRVNLPTDQHPHWNKALDIAHLRANGSQEEQIGLLEVIMNVASSEFKQLGVHTIDSEHVVYYALEIVRMRDNFSFSCIREHVKHTLKNLGITHDDPALQHLANAYAECHPLVASRH